MSNSFLIRPIVIADNPQVATLIRTVMPEFGASGAGFAIHDPEVDDMFHAYTSAHSRSAYFVVVDHQLILGAGGIAPLIGAASDICELRKMYFFPAIRGLGLGQKLMDKCLEHARKLEYKSCYLETLNTMSQAQKLYQKNGFEKLLSPLGMTGHFACDRWYIKRLDG